jgi:hypothetical protein
MTDDLPFDYPSIPSLTGAKGKPERPTPDPAKSRRNRNNRKRGTRHSLDMARTYSNGETLEALGLPEDARGKDFADQYKTHQRVPPREWRSVFAALRGRAGGRMPRLIVRYLPAQGARHVDYIVFEADAWLEQYGADR